MGVKLILAFAAVCLAVVVGGSLFIAGYVFEAVESQIAAQVRSRPTYFSHTDLSESHFANVTVFNQDGAPTADPNKPYIITSGLTAKDDRTSVPYSLQVSGRINNTGGGIAYNAFLNIKAMNAQGVAINENHSFAGITAHMSLGLSLRLHYSGAEIINCTITPIYTDALQKQNTLSSTPLIFSIFPASGSSIPF